MGGRTDKQLQFRVPTMPFHFISSSLILSSSHPVPRYPIPSIRPRHLFQSSKSFGWGLAWWGNLCLFYLSSLSVCLSSMVCQTVKQTTASSPCICSAERVKNKIYSESRRNQITCGLESIHYQQRNQRLNISRRREKKGRDQQLSNAERTSSDQNLGIFPHHNPRLDSVWMLIPVQLPVANSN